MFDGKPNHQISPDHEHGITISVWSSGRNGMLRMKKVFLGYLKVVSESINDFYPRLEIRDIFHRIKLVKFPAKIFPIQSETKDNGRNCNGLELSEIENGKTD